jgi:hypothetical protein
MAYVRLTLLRPRPGFEDELAQVLEDLDAALSDSPGLLFSFVLNQGNGRLGRVSLWLSKDEANREAASERILSLRSRLRYLSAETEEALLLVESGYVPAGFGSLIDALKQPVFFPSFVRQPALPG